MVDCRYRRSAWDRPSKVLVVLIGIEDIHGEKLLIEEEETKAALQVDPIIRTAVRLK